MKIILLTALLIIALSFSGCSGQDTTDEDTDIHVISDRFFSTQIIEIVLNEDDFLGRTIRYTGMFISIHWPVTGNYYYFVARMGDDCCGAGGFIGFEVNLNDIPYVEDYTWVEITGVLEVFSDEFRENLRLDVISMIEIDEVS